MDMVKAVINLKDGVIELEGPQEFVEKYLELYRPDANKLKSATLKQEETKTEGEITKRPRAKSTRLKGTASCMGRIRVLIDENYFQNTKTSTEVMNYLKDQKGATYTLSPITSALNQFIKRGTLRRLKEGKEPYKYCNP